jgi:hypothetical protein
VKLTPKSFFSYVVNCQMKDLLILTDLRIDVTWWSASRNEHLNPTRNQSYGSGTVAKRRWRKSTVPCLSHEICDSNCRCTRVSRLIKQQTS